MVEQKIVPEPVPPLPPQNETVVKDDPRLQEAAAELDEDRVVTVAAASVDKSQPFEAGKVLKEVVTEGEGDFPNKGDTVKVLKFMFY